MEYDFWLPIVLLVLLIALFLVGCLINVLCQIKIIATPPSVISQRYQHSLNGTSGGGISIIQANPSNPNAERVNSLPQGNGQLRVAMTNQGPDSPPSYTEVMEEDKETPPPPSYWQLYRQRRQFLESHV